VSASFAIDFAAAPPAGIAHLSQRHNASLRVETPQRLRRGTAAAQYAVFIGISVTAAE